MYIVHTYIFYLTTHKRFPINRIRYHHDFFCLSFVNLHFPSKIPPYTIHIANSWNNLNKCVPWCFVVSLDDTERQHSYIQSNPIGWCWMVVCEVCIIMIVYAYIYNKMFRIKRQLGPRGKWHVRMRHKWISLVVLIILVNQRCCCFMHICGWQSTFAWFYYNFLMLSTKKLIALHFEFRWNLIFAGCSN